MTQLEKRHYVEFFMSPGEYGNSCTSDAFGTKKGAEEFAQRIKSNEMVRDVSVKDGYYDPEAGEFH